MQYACVNFIVCDWTTILSYYRELLCSKRSWVLIFPWSDNDITRLQAIIILGGRSIIPCQKVLLYRWTWQSMVIVISDSVKIPPSPDMSYRIMPRWYDSMPNIHVHMIYYLFSSLLLHDSLWLLVSNIWYNSNRLVIFFEARLHHQIACQTLISRSAFILCRVLLCRRRCYDTNAVYSHFTTNANLARYPFSCIKSLQWTQIIML